jgi:hypothetical protein
VCVCVCLAHKKKLKREMASAANVKWAGQDDFLAGKCMHVVKHMWLDVCMYVCAPHVIYGTVFLFLLGFW